MFLETKDYFVKQINHLSKVIVATALCQFPYAIFMITIQITMYATLVINTYH